MPNYDECKSLTFRKKKNRRVYEHAAYSKASICVNYLANMHLNQSYVLEVFLIFDEV